MPTQKEFLQAVAKIDPTAAAWLRLTQPWDSDTYSGQAGTTRNMKIHEKHHSTLDAAIHWDASPQGWEYWNDIYYKLGGEDLTLNKAEHTE